MAAVPERAGVVRDPKTGELIIPASQRPDGTWRKARRVKDGYIPQEEVPTYETKGSQWSKSRPDHPIGLSKEDVEKMRKAKEAQIEANTNASVRAQNAKAKEKASKKQAKIPGLGTESAPKSKPQKKQANKTEPAVDSVSKNIAKVSLTTPKEKPTPELSQEDLTKKIRNLKKKIRQIEELESKVASGDLKEPTKEQLEKIEKKQSTLDEITDLESKLTV